MVKLLSPVKSFKVKEKLPSWVVSTVVSFSSALKSTRELGDVFPWIKISGSNASWPSSGLDKFKVRLTGSEVTGLVLISSFFNVSWLIKRYKPPKRRRLTIKIPNMEKTKNLALRVFFVGGLVEFSVGSSVSISFCPFYILRVSC